MNKKMNFLSEKRRQHGIKEKQQAELFWKKQIQEKQKKGVQDSQVWYNEFDQITEAWLDNPKLNEKGRAKIIRIKYLALMIFNEYESWKSNYLVTDIQERYNLNFLDEALMKMGVKLNSMRDLKNSFFKENSSLKKENELLKREAEALKREIKYYEEQIKG